MIKIKFSAGFRLRFAATLIWAEYSGHRRYCNEGQNDFILRKFGIVFIESLLGDAKRIKCTPT